MIGKRLPQIAFAVLTLATIGAFFLIQAVKTSNPLLWLPLRSIPAAINPISGRPCISKKGTLINYAETKLRLAIRGADSVGVYMVNANDATGPTVATLSSGTQMKAAPGPANPTQTAKDSKVFTWNGALADGTVATGGTYYFRIVLKEEDRSINLSDWPVKVITQPPQPRILSVRLVGLGNSGTTTTDATTTGTVSTATTTGTASTTGTGTGMTTTASGPAVLSPPRGAVKIDFTRGHYRRVTIDIYRTDVAGKPEFVTPLTVHNLRHNWAFWNGKIDGQPAPAGTYLAGITAEDQACNSAHWPVVVRPSANTTPGAGITIRYLTVTPPLTPTVSGSRAKVTVSSPATGYVWRLRRVGSNKVLARGSGLAGSSVIHVRMPRRRSGLYTLTVRAGTQRATVPLVASQAGAAAAEARVLVVAPMLTWMGNSPVDDTGDGLPDTLMHGDAVSLNRPLVSGPPASVGSDAALLRYLDSLHQRYQLTTDVALAEGHGPSLVDRWGVLFPGGEEFLPYGVALNPRRLRQGWREGGRAGNGDLQGREPHHRLPRRHARQCPGPLPRRCLWRAAPSDHLHQR